jgi:hypothetical protein
MSIHDMTALAAERERWIANGTFKRIATAIKDRTPVQIKRSSGEMVTGYAIENGFGGMGVSVAWGSGADEWVYRDGRYHFPPGVGVQNKVVHTEDFLEWNPSIAGEA